MTESKKQNLNEANHENGCAHLITVRRENVCVQKMSNVVQVFEQEVMFLSQPLL